MFTTPAAEVKAKSRPKLVVTKDVHNAGSGSESEESTKAGRNDVSLSFVSIHNPLGVLKLFLDLALGQVEVPAGGQRFRDRRARALKV
jgi:hypothetical protein